MRKKIWIILIIVGIIGIIIFTIPRLGGSIEYRMDKKPASIGSVSGESNSDTMFLFIDTLYKYFPQYDIPENFQGKLGHYKDTNYHVDIGYFYFKDEPEEIHELQFSGMIYHKAIYQVHDNKLTKVHGEGVKKLKETDRVLGRIENEVFPIIDSLIKLY